MGVILPEDKLFVPETGVVQAIDEKAGTITVAISRTEACQFCGQCAVSKEDGLMLATLPLPKGGNFKAGQRVTIQKDSKLQTLGIVWLLLLPLLALVSFAATGSCIFPASPVKQALTAFLGLFLAFLAAFLLARLRGWNKGQGLRIDQ